MVHHGVRHETIVPTMLHYMVYSMGCTMVHHGAPWCMPWNSGALMVCSMVYSMECMCPVGVVMFHGLLHGQPWDTMTYPTVCPMGGSKNHPCMDHPMVNMMGAPCRVPHGMFHGFPRGHTAEYVMSCPVTYTMRHSLVGLAGARSSLNVPW